MVTFPTDMARDGGAWEGDEFLVTTLFPNTRARLCFD